MDKAKKKRIIVYISTIILSLIYLLVAYKIAVGDGVFGDQYDTVNVRAKVLRITGQEEIYDSDDGTQVTMKYIYFEAKATSGEVRGKTLYAVQEMDMLYGLPQPDVKAGDKVNLVYEPNREGTADYYLSDFMRITPLVILCAFFFLLVLIFGRKKGLDTIISLVFTCMAVFVNLIPAILNGRNIYLWSIMTCVYITAMTLMLIEGMSIKSLAAGVGCVGGVLVAGALELLLRGSIKMTGVLDSEWLYLYNLHPEDPIDLKAVIFAMIIVGALGAVMDVAMSIASSLCEINEKSPDLPARELLKSGFSIGRDIMGTMANTLVLAYIGSSLCCMLLMVIYSNNVGQIINREQIAVEILQALSGSIGILAALPLTAVTTVLCLKPVNRIKRNVH
ncbi:MAG: YibE/F family protein [Acutalibacteraceae bacterium]